MMWLKQRPGILPAGATRTLSRATDRFKVVALDTLAGSVVTLPPAIGYGDEYEFIITVLATTNSHIIKVQNATDVFRGVVMCLDSNLATVNMFGFVPGATGDTITLDRTNTGSVSLGEWLVVKDVAAGIWHVRGMLSGLAPATPFSATVS